MDRTALLHLMRALRLALDFQGERPVPPATIHRQTREELARCTMEEMIPTKTVKEKSFMVELKIPVCGVFRAKREGRGDFVH